MEFSDIALAKLLQTLPELGPMILTFQDITEDLNEDTGMRAGLFVLRSGVDLFYVPVAAKGDNVYPVDSIFFTSKNKFFPLTKKTLAMVMSSAQMAQGKGVTLPGTVVRNPSVYNLISPPRTGKYAYASSSRLTEFMAAMPDSLKKLTFEKIASEKSMYDSLDAMFGLKAIFDVLKPSAKGAAAVTNAAPISVVTGAGHRLDDASIQDILNKGYSTQGANPHARVALSTQDYNKSGVATEVSELDGDRDYDLAFLHGPSKEAFLPKMHRLNGKGSLAIFTDGSYAFGSSFVTVGDSPDRKKVLTRMFNYTPPCLLKDVYQDDKIAIMTSSGKFLGPFEVRQVALSHLGTELKVCGKVSIDRICGYSNFKGEAEVEDRTLYLPNSSIVIRLKDNVTFDLNPSVNSAIKRKNLETMQYLGCEINLGFDGVEYSVNGRAVGSAPKLMEILVVKEGLAPDQASSFVKQAHDTKFTKIYLSKKANVSGDYDASEMPSYGQIPTDSGVIAPNGAYNPNLAASVNPTLPLQDAQVTECAVISELLQSPDMFELIGEYLPDIEEAIDKLGRILFLSRIRISKLADVTDSESVFAFLAQVKAVYRMLGDNYLKLQELVEGAKYLNGTNNEQR